MASAAPLALTVALLWISCWEPLVPSSRRATWRDQWTADLWHYWLWLSGQGIPSSTAMLRLYVRAWAALPHALRLRTRDWSLPMLLHDIKFAWRMLVRRPAFTTVAVVILALGIGANATIYSWVEAVVLEPIAGVRDQDRLVSMRVTAAAGRNDLSFSYPNFEDVRAARLDGIDDLIAFRGLAMNLKADGEPRRIWGQLVTPNMFELLRVGTAVGRPLTAADGAAPGREPIAVLSYSGWQRLFGGDPAIAGRAVTINGHPFTIVGVAERGFRGTLVGVALDVFIPLTMQKVVMSSDRLPMRGTGWLQVFGRLRPGATINQAQVSATVVAARLAREYPDQNAGRGIVVQPLWRDGPSGMLLPVMATLMAVVGVVLLIACANLAGLLLARAAGRQREVAVRLAVGASRGRVVRQFLVENVLLAAAGGAGGLAIAYWTSGMLGAFLPPTPVPIGFEASLSPGVIGVSTVTTLVTVVLFGLLPSLRASRPDVTGSLKESAANVTSGGRRGRLRQTLVVAQLALSTLLLVCAALFARSFARAHDVDPGFTLRSGLMASIDLLPNGYDEVRGIAFYAQLLQRLGENAQVRSATVVTTPPLEALSGSSMIVNVDGYTRGPDEEVIAHYNNIAPGFFETMGVPIVRGRGIDERDVAGRELSVVINETMAARYWKGRDPIGAIVRFGSGPARVVGIAKDGKYRSLNEGPRNYMYVPLFQSYRPDATVLVRTEGAPSAVLGAIQAAVKRVDPMVPVFEVRTVEEHLQFSVFVPRMVSTLLGLFGALALVLTVVGLYGVIAYTAAQRTHEIGVRMALGATPGEVLGLILRQGIVLSTIGLVTGLGLAAGAGRLVAGQLVGISGTDPVSFAATAAVLLTVSVLACAVPARRASALDPVQALRRG